MIPAHVQRTIDRIVIAIDTGRNMADIMREDERARGHTIIVPQPTGWFPSADWPDDVVASLDGRTVRLVAIYARTPGQGAFHRLISAIQASGRTPCILGPLSPDMQAIMKKWKWKRRDVGHDFETREERWEPRKWRKANHQF